MANRRLIRQGMIGAAVISTLLLTACSGAGGPAASDGSSEGSSDGPLVVYTNSNSDGRGEWVTEKAAEAGIDIEIVGLGGADLTNRIVAEKNSPVGDVVFGLNNMFFEQLKAEEAIAAYTPAWSDQVPKEAGDPLDGAFWPLVEQAIVMAYDKNTVKEVPQDIEELWSDEQFAGRYEVNTALGQATPQLVLLGIVTPHLDESGEVTDEGWAAVEKYFAQGSPAVEGTDLYARITRGEVDFGILPSSGIAARDAEYGTETGVIVPEQGVPYVTEQIAIIKGTGKEAKAQEFMDWFGSAAVQGEFAKEFNAMPVNTEAVSQANADTVALLESLPRQDIDFGNAREHISDWIEKTELEYLP